MTPTPSPHQDVLDRFDKEFNGCATSAERCLDCSNVPQLKAFLLKELSLSRTQALNDAKSAVEKVGWLHHGHPNTPFCYPTKSAPCENFAMRAALQAIEELIAKP